LDIEGFYVWNIRPCNEVNINDISEKHIASIFRVEQYAKQDTSMKQAASQTFVISQNIEYLIIRAVSTSYPACLMSVVHDLSCLCGIHYGVVGNVICH
jgi:hypothetical protein